MIVVIIVVVALAYYVGIQQGSQQPTGQAVSQNQPQKEVNFPTLSVEIINCTYDDFSKYTAPEKGRFWVFYRITNTGDIEVEPLDSVSFKTDISGGAYLDYHMGTIGVYVPKGQYLGGSGWNGAEEFYIHIYPRRDGTIDFIYTKQEQSKIFYVLNTNICITRT